MSHSVQTNSGFGLGINDPRRAWYFVDISPRLVQGISTPKGQNRKISAFHFSLLSILITHSLIFKDIQICFPGKFLRIVQDAFFN